MLDKTLFEPVNIADNLYLKNKFVMAPMTRKLTFKGQPTEELLHYYERRAAGGEGGI